MCALSCKSIYYVRVIKIITIKVDTSKHLLLAGKVQACNVISLFISLSTNKKVEGFEGKRCGLTTGARPSRREAYIVHLQVRTYSPPQVAGQ